MASQDASVRSESTRWARWLIFWTALGLAFAAQVFLAAIGASDGSRAGVTDQLFKVKANTVLGPMKFNQNGDVTSNPVTIYKIKGGKSTTLKVIVPANSLVTAA